MPKPFVKWAGGKRRLLAHLTRMIPAKYNAYHEPFVGGGAMVFDILRHEPTRKCYVSDLNEDLICAYTAIRDDIDGLIKMLEGHENRFKKQAKSYYYKVRDQNPDSDTEKAARLLFLNRTCYNGLYRVNSKNKFNVPIGSYVNPKIINESNLRDVSTVLNSGKVTIRCQDFECVIENAKAGDVIYFDPPYQPTSSTSKFTQYTKQDFSYDDLKRLARVCKQLHRIGCRVILSNAKVNEVECLFNKDAWSINTVQVNRAINSVGTKRTGHQELIITNDTDTDQTEKNRKKPCSRQSRPRYIHTRMTKHRERTGYCVCPQG